MDATLFVVISLLFLLTAAGYLLFRQWPGKKEDQSDLDDGKKKGKQHTLSKSERKHIAGIGRNRKHSRSSHPLLAADLKGHTSSVVDIDYDINGKYLISISEG